MWNQYIMAFLALQNMSLKCFLQYVVKKKRIKLVYYKNYNQFCSRNHDILNARIVP